MPLLTYLKKTKTNSNLLVVTLGVLSFVFPQHLPGLLSQFRSKTQFLENVIQLQTLQIHMKMTKYDICGCLQIHLLLLLLQEKQYWEFVVKDDKYMQLHL